MTTTDTTRAPRQLASPRARRMLRRGARSPWVLSCAVLVVFVVITAVSGLHLQRPIVMVFCAALAFALTARQPERRALALIVDWLPIALVLTAFDYGRGAAHRLGIDTSYRLAPHIDRVLTGTVPTVWLQDHLYGNATQHWWDIFPSIVYFSHYVVPFTILAVLWSRSRAEFRVYARRFIAVTVSGLVVFVLHPTAPPWLASNKHVIPHITRSIVYGLSEVHLHVAVRAFYYGAATQNAVAAFPSLHTAYATLPLMMFWRRSRPIVRVLLVVYPLTMGFTLILTGEHWLADVIAGWVFAAAVALGMPVLERRVARRRAAPQSEPDKAPAFAQ